MLAVTPSSREFSFYLNTMINDIEIRIVTLSLVLLTKEMLSAVRFLPLSADAYLLQCKLMIKETRL